MKVLNQKSCQKDLNRSQPKERVMKQFFTIVLSAITIFVAPSYGAWNQTGHSGASGGGGTCQPTSRPTQNCRPTQSYNRPTQNYSRPEVNCRPTQSYCRPTQNYSRPEVNCRPTQSYCRPTYSEPRYCGNRSVSYGYSNYGYGYGRVSAPPVVVGSYYPGYRVSAPPVVVGGYYPEETYTAPVVAVPYGYQSYEYYRTTGGASISFSISTGW